MHNQNCDTFLFQVVDVNNLFIENFENVIAGIILEAYVV